MSESWWQRKARVISHGTGECGGRYYCIAIVNMLHCINCPHAVAKRVNFAHGQRPTITRAGSRVRGLPAPDHDHARCSDRRHGGRRGALRRARPAPDPDAPEVLARCSAATSRSAPTRSWSGLRPSGPRPAPITVYRALEFLRENGLVHRIESRNAFVACVHTHAAGDLVVFLICERCGAVGEASSAEVAATLQVRRPRRRLHAEIAGDRDQRHLHALWRRRVTRHDDHHVDGGRSGSLWHSVSGTGDRA